LLHHLHPHPPPSPPSPYTTLFRSPNTLYRPDPRLFGLFSTGQHCQTAPPHPPQTILRIAHAGQTPARFHRRYLPADQSRKQTGRSEEHTSELQSLTNLVCRLLL